MTAEEAIKSLKIAKQSLKEQMSVLTKINPQKSKSLEKNALIIIEAYSMAIEALEKAEEYKCLEEQGLLLRLPCKVGDTIYKLWYKPCHYGETYPDGYECCGCEDECDLTREITEFVVPDLDWLLTNMKYLGDLVYFLTQEEAERKLKEMGE